jgi:hypothetical protein
MTAIAEDVPEGGAKQVHPAPSFHVLSPNFFKFIRQETKLTALGKNMGVMSPKPH